MGYAPLCLAQVYVQLFRRLCLSRMIVVLWDCLCLVSFSSCESDLTIYYISLYILGHLLPLLNRLQNILCSLHTNHHRRQHRERTRYLRKAGSIYDPQPRHSTHSELTIQYRQLIPIRPNPTATRRMMRVRLLLQIRLLRRDSAVLLPDFAHTRMQFRERS